MIQIKTNIKESLSQTIMIMWLVIAIIEDLDIYCDIYTVFNLYVVSCSTFINEYECIFVNNLFYTEKRHYLRQVTLLCSFLSVSCKIAITIFDTITIRYPTTSDFFYHNVLLSMPYHVEMLLPKRSSLHFLLSISSIQIPHTNSSKLQTKSMSFIDYNDQSNNPKCTLYLYDSFLHMSFEFKFRREILLYLIQLDRDTG
jgi:hypothetical protein